MPEAFANGNGHADGAKRLRKFKQPQVVGLTRALSIHGTKDARGVYTYQPGYSDEAVRDEVDKSLALDRIAEFRREHFGRLASETKQTARGAVKVHALEEKITGIEERLTRLEERLEPIAQALLPSKEPQK